jgi:hypothetical protein
MAINAKRILITTESHEIFIIRINDKDKIHGYCETCVAETVMLRIDEAVSETGLNALKIFRLVENGGIHFIETATGHLLICAKSIPLAGNAPQYGNQNEKENKK